MKLRFTKNVPGSVRCYGQMVATGDVVDSSVWGDHAEIFIRKALNTGDWEQVKPGPKPKVKKNGDAGKLEA